MLRIIVKIDDFEAYKNILKILKGVGEKTAEGFIIELNKKCHLIEKNNGLEN